MTNSSKTKENEGGRKYERVSKRQSVSKRERETTNNIHQGYETSAQVSLPQAHETVRGCGCGCGK